ncbi:PTS sugar transporter subunit IIB [Streptococcus moroccensis]|nr:PTS sugar transporter subunit IIB [Streptococcus moroccensis]
MCSNGMSTSLLVSKMKDYAETIGYNCAISAYSITELDNIKGDADIILLGPQIRFKLQDVKNSVTIPVQVIDMAAYGMMDGKAVISSVREQLGDV